MQLLPRSGADPSVYSDGGLYTAIKAASAGREPDATRVLRRLKAHVDTDVSGYGDALQHATGKGHEAVAWLLLVYGAENQPSMSEVSHRIRV